MNIYLAEKTDFIKIYILTGGRKENHILHATAPGEGEALAEC